MRAKFAEQRTNGSSFETANAGGWAVLQNCNSPPVVILRDIDIIGVRRSHFKLHILSTDVFMDEFMWVLFRCVFYVNNVFVYGSYNEINRLYIPTVFGRRTHSRFQ